MKDIIHGIIFIVITGTILAFLIQLVIDDITDNIASKVATQNERTAK